MVVVFLPVQGSRLSFVHVILSEFYLPVATDKHVGQPFVFQVELVLYVRVEGEQRARSLQKRGDGTLMSVGSYISKTSTPQ